ncbi:MAG: MFS transporter [Succinivibrio sp.]|nr:MFS transporter [Succinivibrio sp.]
MTENNSNTKENLLFMCGHFATDLCHGSMPVILAYMYQAGRLGSYSQVALLMMANTILNAIVQPLAGNLADRKPRPYLMSIGIFLACLGVMFLGLVENQILLYALVCLNGIGASIFHPEGGKMTHAFGGKKQGKSMSIFSVGGNAGFAAGPFFFTGLYILFGLDATLALFVPGFVMIVIFMMKNRYYTIMCQRMERRSVAKKAGAENEENIRGFAILVAMLFLRSAGWFSFTSFISLYYMHHMGVQDEIATLINGAICLCGAIATFSGGTISDRVGFNRMVTVAAFLGIPFISLFTLTDNVYLATVMLLAFSFLFYTQMSPTVVIGQKLLCRHVGMATGFTIGLSMSFGGLVSPLMGKLGDVYGIESIMYAVAVFMILAAFMSLFIPKVK